jgi:F0F1-type ATP synthase assembly protein I
MLTLITIGDSFLTGALAYVSTLFDDLGLVVVLVIGLPLAFWVIRRIVGLVRLRG